VLRLTRIAETDDRIGEWTLERMTRDTDSPRGVGLAPDGSALLVVDRGDGAARPPTLRRYPIDGDTLGPATVLRSYPATAVEGAGGPAGLCVAPDGRAFVAVGSAGTEDAGAIDRFAADGAQIESIPVSGARPTNCALSGDGRTLYITTANGRLLRVEV
jgi:sugar lactone lactonase YvrE